MTQFKDRAVLVTGASSGIGKATVGLFAQHGANLVLSDVNEREGRELAGALTQKGTKAIFVPADVSSEQQVEDLVGKCRDTFGQLDIMVNCAGIGGSLRSFHEVSTEEWHRIIAVNQTGVFFCMRAALP